MKKYLFFALAVAGMLSSCSNDDIVSDGKANLDGDLMPIQIGVRQHVASTRGTGTVGGFDNATDNRWAAQKVNVYMLEKGKLTLAKDANNNVAFNNQVFITPTGSQSALATPSDNSIKYYNPQGKFDFWGYRLDDAIVEAPVGVNDENADAITIHFTINGSQDVMAAKAEPTNDELNALSNARTTDENDADRDRAYSAFSARYNVQPNLEFKHLLSRLTFNVYSGNDIPFSTTSPVVVDTILVTSPTTGTLYAATKDGSSQRIEWEAIDDNTQPMALMQIAGGATTTSDENLVPLEDVDLSDLSKYNTADDVASGRNIGEALMVAPGLQSLKIYIKLHQPVVQSLTPGSEPEVIEYDYETVIPAPVDNTDPENVIDYFEAGKSYNVKITLWGLNEIQVKTTLTKWEPGGDIELKPEDEERNND